MAEMETVGAMAILTAEKYSKGTASENTQFLSRAIGEDILIDVNVLKFGKVIAYAETKVTLVNSGKLVAHATNEFVF